MKNHHSRPISGARNCRAYALAFVIGVLPGGAIAQNLAAGDPEPTASTGVSTAPKGVFTEPRVIGRAIDVATRMIGDGGDGKNGVYIEMSNMPTGSGWISVGPGYRYWLFGDLVPLPRMASRAGAGPD